MGEHLGTLVKGVLDGLLITRASVGDRTQPPLTQQRLHLLEAGQIVRGYQCLVILRPEPHPMRRRKHLEDRGRVLTGTTKSDGNHRLSAHSNQAIARANDDSSYFIDQVALNSLIGSAEDLKTHRTRAAKGVATDAPRSHHPATRRWPPAFREGPEVFSAISKTTVTPVAVPH